MDAPHPPSLFLLPSFLPFTHSLALSVVIVIITILVNKFIPKGMPSVPTDGLSVTHPSSRTGPPHLRLIHYNDVYHVEYAPQYLHNSYLHSSTTPAHNPFREGSAEPVGGVARFQSVVNYYRNDPSFSEQPNVLTFFSGDAYNPSLESTVTKGRHMVPFLNKAGTDVACVGVC